MPISSPPIPTVQRPDYFDVLIVGTGAAGLYAALCLPSDLQVGLITKDTLSLSASDWAQGGIAAAIAPDDSPELHIKDTLEAGAGLCDRDAVTFLAHRASDCIRSLVEMGVAFDRTGQNLALTLEAAHSRRRVLHAADTTGRALVTTLKAEVLSRKNIQVLSQAFALDVWMNPDTQTCQGICLIHQGQLIWQRARSVILATGGGGQVFSRTTNPSLSTGDGVAIAWRAGAVLRDLEFIQFHPTALTKPNAPRFLISEAVRGEGAHLLDHQGRRFVFDYHPSGELAPRDVVSQAIFDYLNRNAPPDPDGLSHVWLDLRPIPEDTIRHRFPNIIQVCQTWGVDVFRDPIPVAPAAHYWMGGIATDLLSQATIQGIYAIGETANTGVHGANRLASNSLLECLVFGAQLAQLDKLPDVQLDSAPLPPKNHAVHSSMSLQDVFEDWSTQEASLHHWGQKLPVLMWRSAGISREQQSLDEAIAQVEAWQTEFAQLPISRWVETLQPSLPFSIPLAKPDQQLRLWGETRNLLDIAALILKSAAFRHESRGGHYRSDFPQSNPSWQYHTSVQGETLWLSPTH